MGRPAKSAEEMNKEKDKYDLEHKVTMNELAAGKAKARTEKQKAKFQLEIDQERNRYSATLQRRKKEIKVQKLVEQAQEL